MGCDCLTNFVDSYDIELIQGDYGSFVFHITDENGNPLQNLSEIVFTSKRLNLEVKLEQLSDTDFLLAIESAMTSNVGACNATYDITAIFDGHATPYTVIYNAKFIILKKDNTLSG